MKFPDFSQKLIYWYKASYRSLPWRNISDPYRVWLSEIILQQTRVAQGLPYYQKFIDNYPTINDLARAPDDEVMRMWQGLGYYSRARNLLKCARIIVAQNEGKFPESFSELLKLPGIGKYTAAAIASFCFKEKVAVVDGNVFRVLSRIFGDKKDISDSNALDHYKVLSEKLISEDHPDLYNQGMMEFGATQCTPKNPACESCIFAGGCYAYTHKMQDQLPVKSRKTKVKDRKFTYFFIYNDSGCWLKKRQRGDIWADMYDFLWIDTESTSSTDILESNEELLHLTAAPAEIYHSGKVKHILSHQKLQASFVRVYTSDLPDILTIDKQTLKFYDWDKVGSLPKPVLVNDFLKRLNFID